jgi:predicted RND superfamily exporter protein
MKFFKCFNYSEIGISLAVFVIRNRWKVLFGSVLIIVATGYGAKNITFNSALASS